MHISLLQSFILDIGSQSRCYFENLDRSNFIKIKQDNNAEMIRYIADSWNDPANVSASHLILTHNDCNFLFTKTCRHFSWIEYYHNMHFRYSLIINILLNDNYGTMKHKLDSLVYSLYYYRFIKHEDKINNLTQNTCFELQELIKILIDKENTTYKHYQLAPIIDAIRLRITSERLPLLASKSPATINFRKII